MSSPEVVAAIASSHLSIEHEWMQIGFVASSPHLLIITRDEQRLNLRRGLVVQRDSSSGPKKVAPSTVEYFPEFWIGFAPWSHYIPRTSLYGSEPWRMH